MRYTVVAIALGVVAVLGLNVQSQDDGGEKPLKIAVLNLRECFKAKRYEGARKVDENLKVMVDAHAAEMRDLLNRKRDLEDKIPGVPENSDLYLRLLKELAVVKAEIEAKGKIGKAKYLREYTAAKTRVFQEVLRVVEILGKDRGYDLILRIEEDGFEEKVPGAPSVSERIFRRTVLYSAPRVDITDEVLKKLNEEYGKKGK